MKPSRRQKSTIAKKKAKPPFSEDELAGFIILRNSAPSVFEKMMTDNKVFKRNFEKSLAIHESAKQVDS